MKLIDTTMMVFRRWGSYDQFAMPKLHLDHHRDYEELAGKFLANKGFEM